MVEQEGETLGFDLNMEEEMFLGFDISGGRQMVLGDT